ncbi:MAG: Sec-independent protein translocase protein TatB [Betaproteobacteria bacterium]
MFDIAFSEIALIAVVALVVIGPERLPKVARTLGHMFGRLQRYVNDVKADINREIELDELRKLKSEVQSAAQDIERSVSQAASDVGSEVRAVEHELNATAAEAATPVADAAATPPGNAAANASPVAAAGLPGGTSKPSVEPAVEPPAADAPRQSSLPGLDRI